jgi:hypothetical protein
MFFAKPLSGRLSINQSVLLVLFSFGSTTTLFAQPDRDKDPLSYDRNIGGLISRYCYKCHSENEPHGDVNLSKDDNPRLIFENAVIWRTALELIETSQMPPEDAKQPSKDERELIAKFLHETLDRIDCDGTIDPGPPSIRRLNRFEYDRSIQELTGLDLQLSDSFPPDASSYGFENIAASLTLTPVQVEQYYTAAKKVVDAIIKTKAEGSEKAIGYSRVFLIDAKREGSDRDIAAKIMDRFATRAFRRPVEREWLDKLMTIYDRAISQGKDIDQAVGDMIAAVLISPRFLMRYENSRLEEDGPYRIDDYELASRLSFFLWSGPPDDVLMELAARGELHADEQLATQVDRMLADPRSDALIENFFAPWLQFASVRSHQPDKAAFPEFTEELKEAIAREPRLVLAEMIREDRPITDLIDADYTYVNPTLAQHYAISSDSNDFQRVKLSDRRRGGLLTTAALLMVQADPGRTNVPRRGNFVSGTILGAPSPPPPPNVPELKTPEDSDKVLTLRERLEAHRNDAQCASCHDKIDPLGFAFENYDAIGVWRDTEVGKPIDASGQLPSGERFDGVLELKQILLERKEDFARTFSSQLLIYALGRGPVTSDQCVIEDVLANAESQDYRFRSFVRSIVQSEPFRMRRNPEL